jgi:hypothetical protein
MPSQLQENATIASTLPEVLRDMPESKPEADTGRRKSVARVGLIVVSLLWAGMVLGISFLEAPVKFTAPSLTLAVGLDVGRHVFGAFQNCQVALWLWAVGAAIYSRPGHRIWTLVTLVGVCLLLQVFWLYPAMDARVTRIMVGSTPSPAPYHLLYISLEVLKALLLLGVGITMLLGVRFRVESPGE